MDWTSLTNDLHRAVIGAFGEPVRVQYTVGNADPISVDGVFDEGARPVRIVTDPEVNEVVPMLGIQLSQFPAGFDPRNAQDDTFVVRGVTYVVKDGRPDSHGWAILEATRA